MERSVIRILGACCATAMVMSVLSGTATAQDSCPDATDTSTVLTSDCLVDDNLRAAIEDALGESSGADITVGELAGLTTLKARRDGISDATGIEYATGLTHLDLRWNGLTRIDVSKNTELTHLLLGANEFAPYDHDDDEMTDDVFPVTGLDQLTKLRTISLYENELTSIDLTASTGLRHAYLWDSGLTSIDVEGLSELRHLWVNDNELTEITGLGDLTRLAVLKASENQFTSIDLSNNTGLGILELNDNQLAPYDHDDDVDTDEVFPVIGLDKLTGLSQLGLSDNALTSIDASSNTGLRGLYVNRNSLTSVDVSSLSKLGGLGLDDNELTSIDVSDLTSLAGLYLDDNALTSITGLGNLSGLQRLYLRNNALTSIDLAGLTSLHTIRLCGNPDLGADDVQNAPFRIGVGDCAGGL